MYTGFNFKTKNKFDCYYQSGTEMYNKFKKPIRKKLDEYIGIDGSLNGSDIQKDWFQDIEADIFLSHSHKDEDLAIRFAGWLYKEFELITFIDSCIWGYSGDLLKQIDKKYCWKKSSQAYDYDKRNFSTSHVHMMLSTALTKMIDKCECIIFLNTENSTTTTEDIILNTSTQKTYSPWIYSEINCINLIEKKPLSPSSRNPKEQKMYHNFSENLLVGYVIDAELTNLNILDDDILSTWKTKNFKASSTQTKALDNLYSLTIHK